MSFNSAAVSRQNRKARKIASGAVRVEAPTHEGGVGFKYGDEESLYFLCATSMLSGDSFYESQDDRLSRLTGLLPVVRPELIPALAIYTRQKLNLRSIPTVLVAEALQRKIPGAEEASQAVWLRGDEHLEAMAYLATSKQKRTKRFIKAVQARLNKLTEKQALKYAGGSKFFSQKGALILTHPEPADDHQSALFNFIIKGWDEIPDEQKALLTKIAKIRAGETDVGWEQLISREGSTKETWTKAVDVMGYMALIRNIRNLLDKEVDMAVIQKVAATLSDPEQVKNSRQLPFRFLSAYNAIAGQPTGFGFFGHRTPARDLDKRATVLAKALEKAMEASVVNMPDLPGRTLILVDVSGSMSSPISAKSTVTMGQAASVLGAILSGKVMGGEFWAFGTRAAKVQISPSESLLEVAQRVPTMGAQLDHGTEIENAMQKSLFSGKGKPFDRLVIFTDMQTWSSGGYRNGGTASLLERYRKEVNPQFNAYGVNMAGYSTSAFQKSGKGGITAEVGGWSESILSLMLEIERNDPVSYVLENFSPKPQEGAPLVGGNYREAPTEAEDEESGNTEG